MADPPARSPTTNFYSILGISKSASLADIGKAYRSLVMKWHPDRNTSNRAEAEARFTTINEAYRVLSTRKREEADASNHGDHKSTENSYHHRRKDTGANDELIISSPTLLSCTSNRITPTGTPRTFSDGSSHGGSIGIPTPKELQSYLRSSSGRETPPSPTSPDEPPVSLSRATSKRTPTPIIFSRTTARRKAQPIEKKLECTLEELCHGSVKKVKITRDVISNEGMIVQEEETLKIKINPGWKKGTKITFEGKGDEKPGLHPADIIFIIDEKRHPVFKREGDDLELGVEIPLVQALTGCKISVPLLGGDKMKISVDDIIFPGYEKRIPEQGMPVSKEEGKRGDLLLKFLVEFPSELSEEQRSDLVNILDDCYDVEEVQS
ncbi:OLC1v1002416C1 [Oldenlandia corymbosa var. corymbosa]|uniref:OLC1v1002416C1 n=1 Tax=Oldenlandia corymbosa var. corymbosa TaxID=529605 RepID=A0AAV1D7L1_OLDCO|nr:OLC1v1002416C1 [Oldenlandia corymbosa var. corymbosa]